MMRALATVFAGLLGLVFGSFLNVCVSRWPAGESVVRPRSHCRACSRMLPWWENIPLVSWIALRGRCRTCGTWIPTRYLLVEAAMAGIWSTIVWCALEPQTISDLGHIYEFGDLPPAVAMYKASLAIALMVFSWLLIALAALDAEGLWLPDRLTLPGIGTGVALGVVWLFALINVQALSPEPPNFSGYHFYQTVFPQLGLTSRAILMLVLDPLIAAALILLIRWLYWLIRRREGIGLGDAKLMAMLAAWLGLPGALLSFFLGVTIGAIAAIAVLIAGRRQNKEPWSAARLPLGTFLCIGGIISALWGQQILTAYYRWSGF